MIDISLVNKKLNDQRRPCINRFHTVTENKTTKKLAAILTDLTKESITILSWSTNMAICNNPWLLDIQVTCPTYAQIPPTQVFNLGKYLNIHNCFIHTAVCEKTCFIVKLPNYYSDLCPCTLWAKAKTILVISWSTWHSISSCIFWSLLINSFLISLDWDAFSLIWCHIFCSVSFKSL